MVNCETVDFTFPLLADIYYPIVDQAIGYGSIKRNWVLDRTIACYFESPGRKTKEDVVPDTNITIDNSIAGRSRSDVTQSTRGKLNSLTNILITNIRSSNGDIVYNESSGPRVGQPTIFEVATMNPFVGPFGGTEFFKLVLRRSDNQYADL